MKVRWRSEDVSRGKRGAGWDAPPLPGTALWRGCSGIRPAFVAGCAVIRFCSCSGEDFNCILPEALPEALAEALAGVQFIWRSEF